ncbi:hypothetical protein PPERSA_05629 [Pseudocohnilembus persalinus]|uniref:Transmembrane protein n=1 Tax=Pseudocohnilembus persalinus TaxID=266149 RepID=A0A0V0QQT6_PSEPJ|nr:hypothetical protein PPERSA_05629 [Pseudocohnilembus persalinus]|eukprot:KRX04368.1 hypothetical protein PPERSA_05629 [Pseudocohnilembus persalinus]
MSKYIITLILISLIATTTLYYLNQNKEQKLTLTNRNFFKEYKSSPNLLSASEDDLDNYFDMDNFPHILNYGVQHVSQLKEFSEKIGIQSTNTQIQVIAQAYIQTIYNEEDNIFDIAVFLTNIEKNIFSNEVSEENYEQSEAQQEKQNEEEQELFIDSNVFERGEKQIYERKSQFFLVQVEPDSGKILKFKREKAHDEDKLIIWITQQLINDIFPEARDIAYEQGDSEAENLGIFHVDNVQTQVSENQVILQREYDSNDLIETYFENVNIPDIDFDREVLVDTQSGIVEQGESQFIFNYGKQDQQLLSQNQDLENQQFQLEGSGDIEGEIHQSYWQIEFEDVDNLISKFMLESRYTADFSNSPLLKNEKAFVELGDGENEPFDLIDFETQKNQKIVEIYTEDSEEETSHESYDKNNDKKKRNNQKNEKINLKQYYGDFDEYKQLANIEVFDNQVAVGIAFSGDAYDNLLQLQLRVNGQLIRNILSYEVNNCQSPLWSKQNDVLNTDLFKARFPVFGLITINVNAKGNFQYGVDFNLSRNNGRCNLNINPNAKGTLYAEGVASLINLISAGVYSQGNFLHTTLNLNAYTSFTESSLELYGSFKPYDITVGIKYDIVKCNFNRRLSEQKYADSAQRKLWFSWGDYFQQLAETATTYIQKGIDGAKQVVYEVIDALESVTEICKFEEGQTILYQKSSQRQSLPMDQDNQGNASQYQE